MTLDGAFKAKVTTGVILEKIEYCTEYEVEIRLHGNKQGIHTKTENITRIEPTNLKPNVTLNIGYTNLTCSARYE